VLATTLDNSDVDLSYEVLAQACNPACAEDDQAKGGLPCCGETVVRVTPRGVMHTKRSPSSSATTSASDAVVIVRSPGVTAPNVMSVPSSPPSENLQEQTAQMQVVRVEVRTVRHLAVRPLFANAGPLCAGGNITTEVVLRDMLGRVFDSVEGWPGAAQLKIAVNRPDVIRVHKVSVPSNKYASSNDTCTPSATTTCGQGTSGDEKGSTGVAGAARGVLSVVSFSASGDGEVNKEGHTEVVVKLWLANQTVIDPLYMRVDVMDASQCSAPVAVRVRLPLSDGAGLGALVQEEGEEGEEALLARKQQAWEQAFTRDIVMALGVQPERVVVKLVDPSSGSAFADLDLLPLHMVFPMHQDQWHLAQSFARPSSSSSVDTRLPAQLLEVLLQQAKCEGDGCVLQHGRYSKFLQADQVRVVAETDFSSSASPVWRKGSPPPASTSETKKPEEPKDAAAAAAAAAAGVPPGYMQPIMVMGPSPHDMMMTYAAGATIVVALMGLVYLCVSVGQPAHYSAYDPRDDATSSSTPTQYVRRRTQYDPRLDQLRPTPTGATPGRTPGRRTASRYVDTPSYTPSQLTDNPRDEFVY
jgi:hypothetical protein